MPTYQYRCTACSNELEVVQKFTDPTLTTCPECSGSLRKVFNAVGVVFKGSGFYRTDSRSDGKTGAKSDSSSTKEKKADSSSDSGSKTESTKADSGAKSDSGAEKSDAGSSSSTAKASAA
jgi:putative FmdB family regulatory protein